MPEKIESMRRFSPGHVYRLHRLVQIAGFLGLLIALPAAADDNKRSASLGVDGAFALGSLTAKSNEYLHWLRPLHKLSELNWRAGNAMVVKGRLSWDVLDCLTLGARGWSTLSSNAARMDDYDWTDVEQSHWTDWSTHPRTRLNHANEFDLSVTAWILHRPNYRFGAMAGYQKTRFSWTAMGGHFEYNNGRYSGDRSPMRPVVDYRQSFRVPYLGFSGAYRYKRIDLRASVRFSPWVKAGDEDTHLVTNAIFLGEVDNSRHHAVIFNGGYHMTSKARVFAEVSWSKFSGGKGRLLMSDGQTSKQERLVDYASGIENTNYGVTAGLQLLF